ncbi:MAG: cadherin repeat domain-containing protein, partial [Thermoguttaceae bacterium]|nr:cadherin repeat domain-containing protein [Thermoguttaceae bacterium]
ELLVESSRIVGNVAEVYGGGVGLYRGATIVNSAIVGNVAQSGAGVYAQVNASDLINAPNANWDVVLRNDTIAGNFATKNGGGVWTNYRLQLGNTIVNGNAATNGADVYATALLAGGAATAPTAVASNVGRANIAISGARSVDPKFVDFATPTSVEEATAWKEWDLSLQPTSPLVNAGNAAQAVGLNGEALVVDLNGRVRVVGSAVDLGAFEEQGYVPPTELVVTLAEGVSSDAEQGAVVATVEAIGGSADEYAFALDDPSGLFAIDGNTVVVAGELAAGDYEVTVSVGDLAETFVIVVTDPEAEQYATPVITTIGVASDGQVVVAWSVDDPAKEYVVQYRVKGAQEWKQTSALTGDFGKLVDAEFQPGDVVEARIKALASSVKNESDWSDVVEYEVAAPDPAYSVDFNERAVGESYRLVLVDVVSSSAPYAYWKIDWQDGAVDSFTGLSLSRSFSHLYSQSGVYAPVLYVDNMEGVALNAVVVEVADISGAKLEVDPAKRVAVAAENVFS